MERKAGLQPPPLPKGNTQPVVREAMGLPPLAISLGEEEDIDPYVPGVSMLPDDGNEGVVPRLCLQDGRLANGQPVTVADIEGGQARLNGKKGVVLAFNRSSGKYEIQLDELHDNGTIWNLNIRPKYLKVRLTNTHNPIQPRIISYLNHIVSYCIISYHISIHILVILYCIVLHHMYYTALIISNPYPKRGGGANPRL
mgnify:CR=1 FL=1